MFAVAASPTALSAVRGTVRVQRPARDTRHHGRSARLPAVRSRASAQGVDNPATPGDATEPPVSRRWLGAAALSVAVNVSVGAGAARAFGSGVPGYDIDQAARQRALDAIKRCAPEHPRDSHTPAHKSRFSPGSPIRPSTPQQPSIYLSRLP